jgi:hypothetical protein
VRSRRGDRRLNWPNIAALAVWLLSVGTLLTFAERSRNKAASSISKRQLLRCDHRNRMIEAASCDHGHDF